MEELEGAARPLGNKLEHAPHACGSLGDLDLLVGSRRRIDQTIHDEVVGAGRVVGADLDVASALLLSRAERIERDVTCDAEHPGPHGAAHLGLLLERPPKRLARAVLDIGVIRRLAQDARHHRADEGPKLGRLLAQRGREVTRGGGEQRRGHERREHRATGWSIQLARKFPTAGDCVQVPENMRFVHEAWTGFRKVASLQGMASEPPKDLQPEAVSAAPPAAAEAAPAAAVEAAPAAPAVEAAPAVAALPAEGEPAIEPARPAVPAEPVSPAREWVAAVALTIVLGLIAFEFLAYLRNVGN